MFFFPGSSECCCLSLYHPRLSIRCFTQSTGVVLDVCTVLKFRMQTGPDSRSYAVGAVAPWKKTSLSQVIVSPAKAASRNGGLATGFYSGYSAGHKSGDGLDGVIAGATAAYYKFNH